MHGDADIAGVAAVMGSPARSRMLTALLAGRALPASELARAAGVSPATASAHLARLTRRGPGCRRAPGRHRYHRLADDRVAAVVERLATLARPHPVRSLRESNQTAAERAARSCYDHIAGALGVALTDRLCDLGALDRASLSLADPEPFRALDIDVAALGGDRRPLTRSCLDWSERRPHLAGRLGTAVLRSLLDAGWVERRPRGRALVLTPAGRTGLHDALGLDVCAEV